MNDNEKARYDTVENFYDELYKGSEEGLAKIANNIENLKKNYHLSDEELYERLSNGSFTTALENNEFTDKELLAYLEKEMANNIENLKKDYHLSDEELYERLSNGSFTIALQNNKFTNKELLTYLKNKKIGSNKESDVQENPEKENAVDGSELQNLNDFIKADPLNNLNLDVNSKRNNLVKNKSQSMPNVETKNDSANDWKELFAMIEEYGLQLKEIEKKIDEVPKDSNKIVDQVKLRNFEIRQEYIKKCIDICLQAAQKIKGSLNNDELDDYKVKGEINFEPLGEKKHMIKDFYVDKVPKEDIGERTKKIRVDNEGKTIADSINNGDTKYWRIPFTLEELGKNGGTEPETPKKVKLIDKLRNLKIVKKIKGAIDFIREKVSRNKKQSSRDTAELSEEQAEAIKMGAMENAGASVEDDEIEIPEVNVDLQSVEESAKSR